MKTRATDFVSCAVSDIDTSVAFYRDTLGLTLETLDEDAGAAEFALPPTTLALLESNEYIPFSPGGGGFSVSLSVDDVEAAIEELREQNTTVLMEPMETAVCHMAAITDPDDNPIVLHHRKDGTSGRINSFE